MDLLALLRQPHISVITRRADSELARIQDLVTNRVLVDGRADLEELLSRLLDAARATPITMPPKTLDLIGHSIPVSSLLQLGDWILDAESPTLLAFFRGLADLDVLPRLGVHAVRLLGCNTAATPAGRRTITTLADILGLEVHGTSNMIYGGHYDEHGFAHRWRFLLVSSSDIRESEHGDANAVTPEPSPRVLDIDGLPAFPLEVRTSPWPRRLATADDANQLLKLVRRTDGGMMPGLLSLPSCEVVLPAGRPNAYHVIQVVLDGTFVRVYPDGPVKPAVLYPVTDAHALRQIVDALPPIDR